MTKFFTTQIFNKINMPKKDFGKLRPASNERKSVVKPVSVIEVIIYWKLQSLIILQT